MTNEIIFVAVGLSGFVLVTWKYFGNPDYPQRSGYFLALVAVGALTGPLAWLQLWASPLQAFQISAVGALVAPPIFFVWRMLAGVAGIGNNNGRREQRLRGAQLVHFSELNRKLKRFHSRLKVGPLSFPWGLEPRGFLMDGQPGSGKSVTLTQLLGQFRNRLVKGIIFDENGSLLERFYRPGDIILNPLDSRSTVWSPFAEISDVRSDPALISAALIPEGEGEAGEWRRYAQQALAAILKRLISMGTTANQDLTKVLAVATIEDLKDLLQGNAAARLLSPDAKSMAASVLGVLGGWAESLEVLPPTAGQESFSLKKWVQDETANNWIFVTCRDDQSALLERLIATWFSIVGAAVLSLRDDPDRRIVFALDEFDSLPKVNGLRKLITKGRKYGTVPILGLQNVAQVEGKYGKTEAKTILSAIGTWLCFRSGDQETAKYISGLLGKEERVRVMTSESENAQPGSLFNSSTSKSSSEQIVTPDIVLDSELRKLPDRICYIDVNGEFPVAKIEIPLPPESPCAASRFE